MVDFSELKAKMEELTAEKRRILSLTDITGGKRGLKENARLYKRAEEIGKEITKLNKKLFYFGRKGAEMITKEDWSISHSGFDKGSSYGGKLSGNRVYIINQDLEIIATVEGDTQEEAEANAHLIAAAVNACQKVNSDNPMAVAEAIVAMYEVLENLVFQVSNDGVPWPQIQQAIIKSREAIAKAERRG